MQSDHEIDLVMNYLLACRQVVADHQSDGRLKKDKETYVRSVAESFHYTNRGIIRVNYNSATISREIWAWREYQELRQSVFPKLAEHARCVDTLAERYGVPHDTLAKWLFGLTHDVTKPVNPVDQGFLRERTGWLLNDARRGPITSRTRLWLQGVILDGEEFELGNGIVIRRPQASDLEREVHSGRLLSGNLFSGPNPSAIVEYTFQALPSDIASEPFFVERKTETLLQILRLYKVGSIESLNLEYVADSYCHHNGTVGSETRDLPQVNAYSYSLSQPDVEPLSRFIATLLDRIPSYMELLDPPRKPNILGIPLPRYTDCLTREMSVEERIASAVTCFEGLYLTDSDKGDIAYKFAQRLALTLRHFGLDPKAVAKDASRAYGVRSNFVHGVFVKDNKRKETFLLCDRIVNYARISMVLCLQLNHKDAETRDPFLKSLDYAMIDDADAKQLRERLDSGSFVPNAGLMPVHYFQLEESESKEMADPGPTASKIKIHKVEQGQGRVGCHPRGVQIFYKGSTTLSGNPVRGYLAKLLEGHGYEVKDGDPVAGAPIQVLCVTQASGQLTTDVVANLLRSYPELEFTTDERLEESSDSV